MLLLLSTFHTRPVNTIQQLDSRIRHGYLLTAARVQQLVLQNSVHVFIIFMCRLLCRSRDRTRSLYLLVCGKDTAEHCLCGLLLQRLVRTRVCVGANTTTRMHQNNLNMSMCEQNSSNTCVDYCYKDRLEQSMCGLLLQRQVRTVHVWTTVTKTGQNSAVWTAATKTGQNSACVDYCYKDRLEQCMCGLLLQRQVRTVHVWTTVTKTG